MTSQMAADRRACPDGEGPLGTLLDLVIQRLVVARDVAAVKYATGEPIEDPVREDEVLRAVASALNDGGHCQHAGMQFFRDQIEANKAIQRGLHHRWLVHPQEVPPAPRSLAAEIRPRLDRINSQIICEYERLAGMPRVSPEDLAGMVDKRLPAVVSERQLPRLHRAAVLFAMRSLCPCRAPSPARPHHPRAQEH